MKTQSHAQLISARVSLRAFISRPALVVAFVLAFATAFVFLGRAANPAATTIGPDSTTPVKWVGTAIGGSSQGEATCTDGVNCDVFKITVTGTEADWAAKLISLTFKWTVPANDYDFYIHKGSVTGPITGTGRNGGAPETDDNAAIDPAATGVGDYFVHVVYFSVVGVDQYGGTATVTAKGSSQRTASYTDGGVAFSSNVALKAPVARRDGEPSSRTDFKGNAYVGGIRGVPAGVDLWYFDLNPSSLRFDPAMRVPIYRGQPDGFTEKTEADFAAGGGGDIDLAVGRPPLGSGDPATEPPILAYSTLLLANIPTGRSRDRGVTFELNPTGNATGGIPGDDRQWHEFLGANSVYLLYRTVAPAVANIQRSNDGGFTYGATAAPGMIGQVGCLDVHQATGTVYASGSSGVVAVGTPRVAGQAPTTADYTIRPAASDPKGVANIFFVGKVADDGTANGTYYVVYSNGQDIFLKSSKDKAGTFSNPVRVNPPSGPNATTTALFPWMETGPTPGSVAIVWYGTKTGANNDNAEWKVYFAQSFNADGDTPTFRVAEVTEPEHVIHGSNISTGGLTGTANRNLIDYFQVSFDPQGAAVIAYTDDHNDFDGHTYVAHQTSGPSINGGSVPAQVEGAQLSLPAATAGVERQDIFPPRQPGLNGEQITDFELDAQEGSVNRVRIASALDLAAVRYDTSGTGDSLAIAASIRVTDLSTIPPNATWRAMIAANAPHSVLSADGTYSFGVADDADQAYLQASTDATGARSFSYGRVARNGDGTLTYTRLGDAIGEFDQSTNTIAIQLPIARLNAALAAASRPLIGHGSIIAGLRASSSAAGVSDITRGGTQFVIRDSALPAPAAAPSPTPLPPQSGPAAPTPPPGQFGNIASRLVVKTGDQVGIGGFIVRSSARKRVLVRGIAPSLNIAGKLQDPVVEVKNAAGTIIGTNDNWRSTQQAEITASGLAPTDDREAAVILNLPAAAGATYTVTLTGKGGTQGLGVVEVYDVGAESLADLGNISTRAPVGVDDEVLIGGIIVRDTSGRNQSQTILARGIGPSLPDTIANRLQDPTLQVFNAQGVLIAENDDWKTGGQEAAIRDTGIPPTNDKEAAVVGSLAPGGYTVILRGKNRGTGIGVVETYNLR